MRWTRVTINGFDACIRSTRSFLKRMINAFSSFLMEIILDEKLLHDDRQPTFSMTLDMGYRLDLFLPKYQFYIQVILILSIQMLLGSILGIILYFGVILPMKEKQGVSSALLIGYGIVIPSALYIPFEIVDILNIQSVLIRLGSISISMTIPLRCLEAMHGHSDNCKSWRNYVLATSFIFRPAMNEERQFQPITSRFLRRNIQKYVYHMAILCVLCSILSPLDYTPFPNSIHQFDQTIISLHWGDWYNAFVLATLVNETLQMSLSGAAALAGLYTKTQYDYENITNYPMFLSSSPSDFWGRRWNNLIHSDLKRGVYIPCRKRIGSKVVAGLSTFIMSGLLHEHVWMVLFFDKDSYWFGKQLLFFGWNGILLSLEYLLGETIGRIMSKQRIPRIIRNHLVVLLALPLAHLFTMDFQLADGFTTLQQLVPILIVTKLR